MKLLLILPVILFIAACDEGSDSQVTPEPPTVVTVSVDKPEIVGYWMTACHVDELNPTTRQMEALDVHKDGFTSYVSIVFDLDDTNCTGQKVTSFVISGYYVLGDQFNPEANTFALDIKDVQVGLKPHTPDAVDAFNNQVLCGKTDWVLDAIQVFPAEDCPVPFGSTIYTVIKRSGNSLFTGRTIPGTGNTPLTRATTLSIAPFNFVHGY